MEYTVTNVRLEAPMFRALKLRALERGVPAAVLIREAIAAFLDQAAAVPYDWEKERAELLKLCGIGRSRGKPVGTGSTDIDEVVYGIPPRRTKR